MKHKKILTLLLILPLLGCTSRRRTETILINDTVLTIDDHLWIQTFPNTYISAPTQSHGFRYAVKVSEEGNEVLLFYKKDEYSTLIGSSSIKLTNAYLKHSDFLKNNPHLTRKNIYHGLYDSATTGVGYFHIAIMEHTQEYIKLHDYLNNEIKILKRKP